MKTIQINGKSHDTQAATVVALLAQLQLAGKPVAVERNGEVLPRRLHGETPVVAGDVFELVTLVGGG